MAELEDESVDFGPEMEAATCREDVVELLRKLLIVADEPSRRDLMRWAAKNGKPALAIATQSELLSGKRWPKREVVLAFIEGCGVRGARLKQWERMLVRVALAERGRPTFAEELEEQRRQALAETQVQVDAAVRWGQDQLAEAEETVRRWKKQAAEDIGQQTKRAEESRQQILAEARAAGQRIQEEAQQHAQELIRQAEARLQAVEFEAAKLRRQTEDLPVQALASAEEPTSEDSPNVQPALRSYDGRIAEHLRLRIFNPDLSLALALPHFDVVLRGYNREQVDKYLYLRASQPGLAIAPSDFDVVLRGYNREQVDAYIQGLSAREEARNGQ